MFKKVLISDDLGSINTGVFSILKSLGVEQIEQVQYCDDAYLKIKAAIKNNAPFDLLITDLSFIADHREQRFSSGESLVQTLKKEHAQLKIIIYSIEDKLQRVRSLIKINKTNGYVCKGRKGLDDLTQAINDVFQNRTYVSSHVKQALEPRANLEIDDYDIMLLKHLSMGLSQDQISLHFKEKGITPNSLSTVEKRLNKLRIQFRANNAIHLVAIVKDLGLI